MTHTEVPVGERGVLGDFIYEISVIFRFEINWLVMALLNKMTGKWSFSLKGVFAKNEREYRLQVKNKRF